ncbi:response regulator [Flavobacterium sp. NST-5]|uniref:Response regulator n=1 Tax=Flavobacterium ichthyis TaxID=2698827 RepID=A0ABW9ZB17_9FLAO|nr:response regulator [Flavobacterium ichthyis]NBL65300.1 response regulator [Flavobacterium ichthyis]
MKNEFTIFYTDDDLEDQEFFSEAIDGIKEKIELVTQNSGNQLLNDLENPPPNPHVVFLDLNMPGLNGLQTLEKIRSIGKFKKLPIVIFSTSGDEETINQSRNLGASFYVKKPNDFNLLTKTIQFALNINWETYIPTKENFVYLA